MLSLERHSLNLPRVFVIILRSILHFDVFISCVDHKNINNIMSNVERMLLAGSIVELPIQP